MDSFFFDKELAKRQQQRIQREEELRKQVGVDDHVWNPEEIGWLEILNYIVRTPWAIYMIIRFVRCRSGRESTP